MSVSDQVVRLLYRFVRPDKPTEAPVYDRHRARVEYFVRRLEPIHFVLPAFPAKSPNLTKVLGPLPDLGEQLALGSLESLCEYVSYFHPPGARVTICSDGHVFGDVVGVCDQTVTEYRALLSQTAKNMNLDSLELYGLDDAFGGSDYPALRKVLEAEYAPSIDKVRASVRTDESARTLFNGIHRFMFEDAVGTSGGHGSRTSLRNKTKETALHTISRSQAWSSVIAERFPRAVRLSIHPQPPNSDKIGVRLLASQDEWLTPWHGVVLDDGAKRSLVKRWQAEEFKALLVWRDGRPSHFVGPHLSA
ncbi:L-tyrosine/L-tryptophan isonitrile synthase family protein [Amycolatopsis sp. RM579]|uniref:L-tyrosine/L-tryptophan isonitrile synthase family protein n=2 Tax=Amycolatopsis pithecellobii TaxID=664692 RepID=A0A6N7YWL5_9PSEU|nr:L-tyrosine/L-tryptophan isonitrile synthase family protein [Amycolatopsis pithecellobii]